MRPSGWPNETPCSPSITWGPDTPRPSRNRPPDRWASVIAVCAIVTGERVPIWITPEPSSIRSVRAAREPSGASASAPQASATQQTSRPSLSASTANSTASLPDDASMVVAVRIYPARSALSLISARLCLMPVSCSRIRTKTILASLSGIASMAIFRPERAGPIWYYCSSRVPSPSGFRVKRQVADGQAGSPTTQAKRCGGSHSVTVLTVSHSPMAGWALRPVNRWPTAGPVTPSSQVTSCSSELSSAISAISLTRSHTRSGGASIPISAATTGLSAYTCPVHSMKSRLERHCGSRLNRGTTSRVITAQAQPAEAGDPAAAAPALHLPRLRKRYGDVTALADVDLVVRAGEFFTLLGPSGSGKTTLLRLIAGFERPDAGRIELAGRDVTRVPPYARDVNTVFQDYALFPHMTVAENIEYGLRVRHVAKAQRRAKVDQALEMVRLPGLGGRKPAQVSGGQRQRVPLARGLVNEPSVLLLDAPLCALGLKLRQEMQLELQRVQREVSITFVYVTHDQEEALTMSDRIAVLSGGRLEQIGGAAPGGE